MRFMEWGHTEYYHPFLLRNVPEGARRALDVGCGTGLFARRLADRVAHVDAIDISDEALSLARRRSIDVPNVRFRLADLLDSDIEPKSYDYVSCLMCIHHMPFEPAIQRMASLLRPGGVLAILGLGQLTVGELPRAFATLPLDMAMGIRFKVAKALGRPSLAGVGPEAPVMNPRMRWGEIRRATATVLPGSSYKRHIFYRYSLIYRAD
jgi:SAM-dependent methyltransferase